MTFEALQLVEPLVRAVREQGYTEPTPIQAQAIPLILAGHDLLGGAQTGTGKTAAFVLPTLQRLSAQAATPNRQGGVAVRALVLTPTRELAAQVEESVRVYGQNLNLSSTVVFGGVGLKPQIERLRRGVDILVATPGRLLDLQQQGALDLSAVQVLVLDEADRMLDMGFIHDVKKVLALLPSDKQSLLFSATFSDEIRELASGLLHNPQQVQVTPRNTTVQRIAQVIHPVAREQKKALLLHILQQNNWSQVLVFTRTKFGANNVADYLEKNGVHAMALHGNKSQTARTQALAGFKAGEIRALVATDIAARGIDIDDLPHVVNYDIPNVCEDYVHRIGRTGRAGAEGTASSLVSLDEEGFMMAIERFTRQEIPVQAIQEFMPGPDEQAQPIAMGRQVLWGGAGKPPSREVMNAAAKAARGEMMQRIRDNKAARPAGRSAEGLDPNRAKPRYPKLGGAGGPRSGASKPARNAPVRDDVLRGEAQPSSHLSAAEQAVNRGARGHARGFANGVVGYGAGTLREHSGNGGQPDPMRTSVDLMGKSARSERPHFFKEPKPAQPNAMPGMRPSGPKPGAGKRRSPQFGRGGNRPAAR